MLQFCSEFCSEFEVCPFTGPKQKKKKKLCLDPFLLPLISSSMSFSFSLLLLYSSSSFFFTPPQVVQEESLCIDEKTQRLKHNP